MSDGMKPERLFKTVEAFAASRLTHYPDRYDRVRGVVPTGDGFKIVAGKVIGIWVDYREDDTIMDGGVWMETTGRAILISYHRVVAFRLYRYKHEMVSGDWGEHDE